MVRPKTNPVRQPHSRLHQQNSGDHCRHKERTRAHHGDERFVGGVVPVCGMIKIPRKARGRSGYEKGKDSNQPSDAVRTHIAAYHRPSSATAAAPSSVGVLLRRMEDALSAAGAADATVRELKVITQGNHIVAGLGSLNYPSR